jgi:hypothetical protein
MFFSSNPNLFILGPSNSSNLDDPSGLTCDTLPPLSLPNVLNGSNDILFSNRNLFILDQYCAVLLDDQSERKRNTARLLNLVKVLNESKDKGNNESEGKADIVHI